MHAACSDAVVALDEWPVSDAVAGGFGAPILRREDPRMLTGNGRYVADLPDGDCLSMILRPQPRRPGRHQGAERGWRAIDAGGRRHLHRPRCGPPASAPSQRRPRRSRGTRHADSGAGRASCRGPARSSPSSPRPRRRRLRRRIGWRWISNRWSLICDPEAAIESAALFREISSNVVAAGHWRNGDPDLAFAGAAVTAEVTVRHPRVAPGPLECRASLAQWDRGGAASDRMDRDPDTASGQRRHCPRPGARARSSAHHRPRRRRCVRHEGVDLPRGHRGRLRGLEAATSGALDRFPPGRLRRCLARARSGRPEAGWRSMRAAGFWP